MCRVSPPRIFHSSQNSSAKTEFTKKSTPPHTPYYTNHSLCLYSCYLGTIFRQLIDLDTSKLVAKVKACYSYQKLFFLRRNFLNIQYHS